MEQVFAVNARDFSTMFTKFNSICLVLLLCLDPYGVARGGETVLHWACQSMVKNEKFIDQLLTASAT